MLFIRTFCEGILFYNSESIVIYDEQYAADHYGNKLPEDDERISSGKYYEYGNIVIESPSMKVVFTKVYTSYDWCAHILNYIEEHISDNAIVLDLNTLIEWKDEYRLFECGDIIKTFKAK